MDTHTHTRTRTHARTHARTHTHTHTLDVKTTWLKQKTDKCLALHSILINRVFFTV